MERRRVFRERPSYGNPQTFFTEYGKHDPKKGEGPSFRSGENLAVRNDGPSVKGTLAYYYGRYSDGTATSELSPNAATRNPLVDRFRNQFPFRYTA